MTSKKFKKSAAYKISTNKKKYDRSKGGKYETRSYYY